MDVDLEKGENVSSLPQAPPVQEEVSAEQVTPLIPADNNYDNKKHLIQDILEEVKKKKQAHYKQFCNFKQSNMIIKSLVNSLNAVSVCSMVLNFTDVSDVVMFIALTSTTISSIMSAVNSSIDLDGKIHSHKSSYLQYTDLYRDVSARILKNNMSSQDLDILLNEMNPRMGLIEDQSQPINIK